MTDTVSRYSSKAEKYVYRWDYAPAALETILDMTRLSSDGSLADIGSGTGMLARHFVDKVGTLWAVEPNEVMRRVAEEALGHHPSFHSVVGMADATTLDDHSTDVIAVGQALHLFDPGPTRKEFLRILDPQGWLAVLWNRPIDRRLNQALATQLYIKQTGYAARKGSRGRAKSKAMRFFYGTEAYLEKRYVFAVRQSWSTFLGGLLSDSRAPDEDHPLFPAFERAAHTVFRRFSRDGIISITIATDLFLGQMWL